MQQNILYTTPFGFPDHPAFPKVFPPLSSLRQGPEGIFGIALSTLFESEDLDHYALPCFLFEADLNTGTVTEHSSVFSYRDLYELHIHYDEINKTWVVALESRIKKSSRDGHQRVLDLYEIADEEHDSWSKLLRLEEVNAEAKLLVDFWQYGQHFPLIVAGNLGDGLSAARLFGLSWRPSDPLAHKKAHRLGKSFLSMSYHFDETFLLFTTEYQRATSQWRLRIAAYDIDGTRLHQELVPKVFFPSRHTGYYFADDLWDWLWPTMRLTPGPRYGIEKKPTCVAVLLLKEQLERSRRWKEGRLLGGDHGLPPVQGGLYWVDQHGHILRHEAGLFGEQISLCLCGQKVVGVDRLDGQWRLWSWSPEAGTERTIGGTLSSEAKRVTVIAMGSDPQEEATSFWCLEEYVLGVQVSIWEVQTFREVQSCWVEGILLADRWSAPGNDRDICAATYQKKLLVVGVTRERRFQIIQFCRERS